MELAVIGNYWIQITLAESQHSAGQILLHPPSLFCDRQRSLKSAMKS